MPEPVKQVLYLRTPFRPVDGTTPSDYKVVVVGSAGDPLKLTVEIDPTDPARLELQPVFPGELVFRPAADYPIPNDPSDPKASSVPGDLFLTLSPAARAQMEGFEVSMSYHLVFAYLDVWLTPEFFRETVGGGKRSAKHARAFAEGKHAVTVKPDKTALNCRFPSVRPNPATGVARASFALGVRVQEDAFDIPPALTSLTTAEILAAPGFVPIPPAFFYTWISTRDRWEQAAGDGHFEHPLLETLRIHNENPALGGPWRRLMMLVPDQSEIAGLTEPPLAEVTVRARSTVGAQLWEQRVNLLGEQFVRRPDEAFQLDARNAQGAVPLSVQPDETGKPAIPLRWDGPDSAAWCHLLLRQGNPLEPDPQTGALLPLREGFRDYTGRTVNWNLGTVAARRELVRQLQLILSDLGFSQWLKVNGKYGHDTRNAVREFQRQARTKLRTRDGVDVPEDEVTPFTGKQTGIADEATLLEMRHWVEERYKVRARVPWPLQNQWSDPASDGQGGTYADQYNRWTRSNIERFNDEPYMCNWFPLRLLVEFAAKHGLRVRLRYWAGLAQTGPGRREWNEDDTFVHDSHGGFFESKLAFYSRVKGQVTARMIGQLNMVEIARADVREGDVAVYPMGYAYWHNQVAFRVSGEAGPVLVQQGSAPDPVIPSQHQATQRRDPPVAYGRDRQGRRVPVEGAWHRWNSAQFDALTPP